MKTIDEVLTYIDEWYERCLANPKLYASTPSALEEVLGTFEEIHDFIILGESGCDRFGYMAFLREKKDVGSLAFVSKRRQFDKQLNDGVLFQELADTWREYLRSEFRASKENRHGARDQIKGT